MKTATVGEIQKNLARILRGVRAGEEIMITRRGKPVARLTALGPKEEINWPDFFNESMALKGRSASETVMEQREDWF